MKFSKERKALIEKATINLKAISVKLQEVVEEFNEAADIFNSALQDGVEDSRREWEDKTERWQESERGEILLEWLTALEAIVIDTVDIKSTLISVNELDSLDTTPPPP